MKTLKSDRYHPPLVILLTAAVLVTVAACLSLPLRTAAHGLLYPQMLENDQSHITDGIVALGILLVIIIIGGVLWGSRANSKARPPKKKKD
jgi:protein-S-isoprenylcysteine O-methyltransferase Ste14